MNQLIYIVIVLISISYTSTAQTRNYLGLGYFGETLTHPGLTFEYCHERFVSYNISFPLKASAGFYIHKRNHNALFAIAKAGVRWHITKRLHTGINLGIGPMLSWYNSDLGVFEVNDNNDVTEIPNYAGIDIMPTLELLDIGYRISRHRTRKNHYAWIRPTLFWQMVVNESSFIHTGLQLGYSIEIF